MEGITEAHVVPAEWRKRYSDAIVRGDLLEFVHIFQICDDRIFFPIVSAKGCTCFSVMMEDVKIGIHTVGYPLCQRLSERISSGTCDCANMQQSRIVWFSSLHLACYYGKMEIVKHLVQFSQIAGNLAGYCGQLEMVMRLLQFSQTAEELHEKALLTPLMVTSLSDAKDVALSIASLLVNTGANIDDQDENGFAALHFAVINNNPELVKLYLQWDANINILAFSLRLESPLTLHMENCGLSPLWFAAKFLPSRSLCEGLLLAAGANVTDWLEKFCPLVAVGGKEGFEGVLRYMRSPGFDINHRSPSLGTLLINAIYVYSSYEPDDERRRVWFQVIKYYLEMGVDVNTEDEGGRTAVFYCSQHYEVLELLISYGADVKHVDCNGMTTLMEAFKTSEPNPIGSKSCVRLLLESGSNPSAVSVLGCNALLNALDYSYQNDSDIRLLFEYNMDMDDGSCISLLEELPKPLLYTVYDYANFEVAELFLEYGLDMTRQDWLLDTDHLPKGLKGNDNLYNRLLQLYKNPVDLIVLVRNKLRRLLGRHIGIASTLLGLPIVLENFVTCK